MRRAILMALAVLPLTRSVQAADVMNTDRPSFSNSTVIVTSGSLQAESGVSRQKSQNLLGTKTWLTQTPLLLRAGLAADFEARLNWNGYEWKKVDTDRSEGAGDLSAGFKWRHREASG